MTAIISTEKKNIHKIHYYMTQEGYNNVGINNAVYFHDIRDPMDVMS